MCIRDRDPAEIPSPELESTFLASKLNWEFSAEQQRIFEAYTQLLRLRKELGFSQSDLLNLEVDHGDSWLSMANGEGRLVANFSTEPVEVPFGGRLIYSFTAPQVTATTTATLSGPPERKANSTSFWAASCGVPTRKVSSIVEWVTGSERPSEHNRSRSPG